MDGAREAKDTWRRVDVWPWSCGGHRCWKCLGVVVPCHPIAWLEPGPLKGVEWGSKDRKGQQIASVSESSPEPGALLAGGLQRPALNTSQARSPN